MNRRHACLAVLATATLSSFALADEPVPPAAPPGGAPATDLAAAVPAPVPGSSDDVNYELATARPRPAGILRYGVVSLLDPVIDDVNARLKEAMCLEIGMAYTSAWQRSSDGEIKDAAGGDADMFARWTLLGAPGSADRGVLGVNAEYRHDYGEHQPRELGDDAGSLWRTTNGFGIQDAALIQFWWEQHLADDAVILTFGKMDPDNLYNTNRYQSDATAFMSRMFSASPVRAHPSNGLGANVKVNLDPEWYLSGGFQDANGDKTRSGFGTIDEKEFFTAAEAGWTPKIEGWGKGAYRLTIWDVPDREEEDVPDDWGVSVSCEQEIGGGIVPFLRAGWSEGDVTGVERFIGGGVGLEGVLRAKEDLTGIGIGWGDPSDGDLDSQWGGEVFHRFQLAPDVQLTLGYQYVLSPSYDDVAGDDPVGTFEIRVRITF